MKKYNKIYMYNHIIQMRGGCKKYCSRCPFVDSNFCSFPYSSETRLKFAMEQLKIEKMKEILK